MIDIGKFRNIRYEKRTMCMACGAAVGKPLISLPDFPLSEIYTDHPVGEKAGFVDQEFCLCKSCGHGQLLNIIPPELLYFGSSYFFRTSQSKTVVPAVDFFLDFIEGVLKGRAYNTIADIGCNDLYMLKKLGTRAKRLLGIDPVLSGREKELSDDKTVVIGDLFENAVARHNVSFDKDLVLSSHTLEHVKDPKWLVKTVLDSSTQNTLFGFQFPGFESLVRDARFDQVFHQHYNYFTLKSVIRMLTDLGAELIAYKVNPYHWGALMIVFRKNPSGSAAWHGKFEHDAVQLTGEEVLMQYTVFRDAMKLANERLAAWKGTAGTAVYGYGAANMLPILSYHMKNDLSCLQAVLDDDERKQGMYYINLPVAIKSPSVVKNFEDVALFLTAIDNSRILVPKLISLRPKKVILPLNIL